MENKRKFLVPVAVALAAMASQSNSATASVVPAAVANTSTSDAKAAEIVTPSAMSGERVGFDSDGNLFSFVLKRSEAGELVAYHESHRSHSSHRSHYSSRY